MHVLCLVPALCLWKATMHMMACVYLAVLFRNLKSDFMLFIFERKSFLVSDESVTKIDFMIMWQQNLLYC